MGAAYRLAASFLVMLSLYGCYTWVVVPWIEPPAISAGQQEPPDVTGDFVEKRDLTGIFPPGSWQLDQPKVLETGKGMLLFSEFDRLEDGRIKLTPCSLVLFLASKGSEDKSKGRPMVLDAPSGAILNADPDMDMTGPSLTRIEGGHLLGEVAIFGPPSKPGVNDSIAITTRTVQFSKQKIWTTNTVKFRFGPHVGSGRDLAISLVQQGKVRKRSDQPLFAAGVTKLELVHLDHIDMKITDGIFSDKKKSGDESAQTKKPMPARITCKGPFTFDVPSKTATFEEQVQVAIKQRQGAIDQLICPDRLTIEFEKPRIDAARKDEKKKGHGSLDGMRPIRVVARGNPARMIARSAEADISAQVITYFPPARRVEFADPNAVSVRHLGYRIRAPRVEYTLHRDSKRLGMLEASGPGTLDGFRKLDGQTQKILGEWKGDLRIRRDSAGQPVLSLHDGAHVGIEGTGQFTAQNVFVWLKERKQARKAPKQAGLTPVGKTSAAKSGYELRVDRVGAYGQVAFDTPQLVGGTDSLEMWMRYVAATKSNVPSANQNDKKDKGQSVAGALAAKPKPRDKQPSSRYRLAGRRIRMQVTKVGEADPAVNDVTIDGEVQVTEITTADNPRDALNVSGDMVRLSRNDVNDERPSSMQIQGRPAQVAMNGATMIGREIRFDQPTNRIWIDGGGEMLIPAKKRRRRAAPSPPMRITWEGGMQFNGGRTAIVGDVRIQGMHRLKDGRMVRYTVRGDKLDVTMSRFVDFKAAMKKSKSQVKVEPHNLIFAGSVVMDGEGLDEYGQRASLEHMEVQTLTLNTKSEAVRATGPGWVSSLRFEGDAARQLEPNARITARKRKQLVYLRTAFRRTMEGNYGTQQVQFLGDVQTVYGPVPDWNTRLNLDRPGGLGEEGIIVRCDRLLVVQEKTKDADWIDVTASGNSWVENEAFRAQAERITYTQLKDRLVLEGARDYARMWLTRSMSSKPDVVARKVTYMRKTNQVKSEDTRSINIQNFNGLLE